MKTVKDVMDRHYARRWGKKIKAINLLGGFCKQCKNKNIFQLEFHHRKSGSKNKEIDDLLAESAKWSVIEKELASCILLCRNCHAELHSRRNDKIKSHLLSLIGKNKCSKCGYHSKNISSLEFHHRKSGSKEFGLSKSYCENRLRIVIERILLELKKCIVICRNCHNLEHINHKKFKRLKSKIDFYVSNTKENAEVDRDKILRLRRRNNMAYRKIAKITGCSKSVVCNVCNVCNEK